MAEVVDIGSARRSKVAGPAFSNWGKRLGFTPGPDDALAEIPDNILIELAELESEGVLALYDVVLGVRGWGAGEAFNYLEPDRKMEALDAYLFLADQVRFEVMRRLGWLGGMSCSDMPITDLALNHKQVQARLSDQPELLRGYPRYDEMTKRLEVEPEAAMRSVIPEALSIFRRKVKSS